MGHQFVKMFQLKNFVLTFCLVGFILSECLGNIELDCNSTKTADVRIKRALKKGGTKKPASNECVIPICKSTTSKMLVAMNHHADACEEFPELVCGNKVQEHGFSIQNFHVLENYLATKIEYNSEKFLQDFKRFYQSCIHYSSDFNFFENLNFVKTFSATDITDVFVESILTQSMLFFDVGLDIGSTDETYQFLLTLPGESILKTHTIGWSILEQSQNECLDEVQKSICSKTVDLDQMYSEYSNCKMGKLFKYAEDYEMLMKTTNKLTENEAYLKELLQIYEANPLSPEMIRNTKISKQITVMTMNEITDKYGIIDWKIFFGKIRGNNTFIGDEKVLIAFPHYFQNIFDNFKKIEQGKLIKMIQELISLHLYRNILLTKATVSKEFQCTNLAQELMPDVVSWILYDLSPAKKIFLAVYQANKMFADLKDTMKKALKDSSLDDMSKEKFVKKVERLNLGLITTGDTNTTRDNYKLVRIRDNYHENVVVLLKNYRQIIYDVVYSKSSPATLLNLFVSGFFIKPVTFYTSDSIVLHPEIYKTLPSSLPEHIRLAKLGFSLAQAIAKHFDPTGRLFMTDDIKSNDGYYDDLVTHMTEVFDKYYAKVPYDFHGNFLNFKPISSKLLVNEMIADNAAFKLVTDYLGKMKKPKDLPWVVNGSISFNQTFLIAFSQEFCDDHTEATFMRSLFEEKKLPYQIKIRNIVSNSQFFSKSYNCLEGSSLWLDASVIRQFPQAPDEYYDQGQVEGQYES